MKMKSFVLLAEFVSMAFVVFAATLRVAGEISTGATMVLVFCATQAALFWLALLFATRAVDVVYGAQPACAPVVTTIAVPPVRSSIRGN